MQESNANRKEGRRRKKVRGNGSGLVCELRRGSEAQEALWLSLLRCR